MNDIRSTAEEVERLKRKFIEDALLLHALTDSLSQSRWKGRARAVFGAAPTDPKKKDEYKQKCGAFRDALKAELRSLAKNYEGHDVDDERHIQTIRGMGNRLTAAYADILNDRKLVFGVAQKALNVYLKYLFCANLDIRPPHCPFDYDIISRLDPTGVERRWTHSDSEDDYREWVRLAKEAAKRDGYKSASDWEIATWDEIQRKKSERAARAAAKKNANPPSDPVPAP